MSAIKELRTEKKLTQQQAAEILGISLRSYKSYENDTDKVGTLKYNYIIDWLSAINPIDEQHGILELDFIKEKCKDVLSEYPVHYCILFGSYSKGKAVETSIRKKVRSRSLSVRRKSRITRSCCMWK